MTFTYTILSGGKNDKKLPMPYFQVVLYFQVERMTITYAILSGGAVLSGGKNDNYLCYTFRWKE